MDRYRIKQGIPIPPKGEITGLMEVLREMEVGDCIDADLGVRRNVSGYAHRARIKITTRTVINSESGEKFLRVWRVG